MRSNQFVKLLLATACYLAGQPGWAQRTAVAPLAPLPPVVRPMSPVGLAEGVKTGIAVPRTAPVATTAAATRPAWPEPVYLLDSRIILDISALSKINPRDIAVINIYKAEVSAPAQWRSLAAQGIVSITLKPGVKKKLHTESLAHIRRRLKLSGPVSFQLGGLPIEDTSLRVVTQAIAGLDILHHEAETVINIRLAPPKPTPPLPPGSIRIRGVVSR